MTVLHLFTGDLRLDDNPGLAAALRRGPVLAGLLLAPWHRRGGDLVESALCDLKDRFLESGGVFLLREGPPAVEALRLLEAGLCDEVTVTLPRHRELDAPLEAALAELAGLHVTVRRFDDAPTVTPYPLLDESGRPAADFATFKRLLLAERERPHARPRGDAAAAPDLSNLLPVPPVTPPPSPARLFRRFTANALPALGDPAAEFAVGGSGLGPHLRHGTVSMRSLLDAALALPRNAPALAAPAARWLDRILRGEFCRHIARARGGDFGLVHDHDAHAAFPFENRADRYEDWATGRTGCPAVDAAMREAGRGGRLPHALRSCAAAWLIQIAHMDWRLAARRFRETLPDHDDDIAAWHLQRLAGCLADAPGRPHLVDIAARYRAADPEARFVRARLPALRDKPADLIHRMNETGIDGTAAAARRALYLERLRAAR